jgi:hypothetical protein
MGKIFLDEVEFDGVLESRDGVAEEEMSLNETVEETSEQDSISLHSTPSLRFEPVEDKPSKLTYILCRESVHVTSALLGSTNYREVQILLTTFTTTATFH